MASDRLNESSDRIRVLLADLPGVMSDLLSDVIRGQPDMTLVGMAQDGIDLLVAAGQGVDVVIMGASQLSPPPGICTHLLSEYPDLRILVLAQSGDQAALYWLGLRRQRVHVLSAQTLMTNIRRVYRINPAT